ncbi:MAG: glycosyltransferase family 2 protein, partial [Proteobacteria bacterium]|nr:glycosyltransferase family 2 protein [Pseudomonadota bacterium]
SVQREIARYDFDTEIVVVNNNSKDRTKEIVGRMPGVTIVDETQKGLVFARKCGLEHSTGELIANIDADVVVPEGWLSTVMAAFARDPRLVALSGPYIYHDLGLVRRILVRLFYYLGYVGYILNSKVFRISGMLQGGNFIVRRDAMAKIGGYDTRIAFYGEDTDVAKRIFKVGKVLWTFQLPMYTSGRRLREEGLATMGIKYAMNHVWPIFFSKPFTTVYKDIRE